MATTSPDNLVSPDSGDDYNLTADWAASMASIQTALTNRATRYGGTVDRLAATGLRPGTVWFDSTEEATYWYSGTGWTKIYGGDTGWINITSFGSSVRAGDPTPAYRIRDRWVQLRGSIERTSGNIASGTLCTLPAAARPSTSMTMVAAGATGSVPMRAFVSSGGAVSVTAPLVGSTTYVALDNLKWYIS